MRPNSSSVPPRALRFSPSFLGLLLPLVLPWQVAAAQDNETCMECHEIEGLSMEVDGREISLQVDWDRYDESIHAGLDCITCHYELDGVEEYPHARGLERVACTDCHDDDAGPITDYHNSTHGQLAEAGDPLAPLCQDCHGGHYVLPLEDPRSSISPFNIPRMCAQCHTEDSPVERTHDLPQEHVFERYQDSIHGEGLFKQGLSVTAVCTSCHTGHNVLPHTDPASSIHKDQVVATCMQCHGRIEEVHRKVIGGELWEKQAVVPVCVECHLPHEVRKVFYDTNMANADCMACHGKPLVSVDGRDLFVSLEEHAASTHGRNGVSCAQCHSEATPSVERSCATIQSSVDCGVCHEGEVQAYEGGIHGRLHAENDPNAPSCTDCHGIHDVLEHDTLAVATEDLKSLVRTSPTFSRNVPGLCARCHQDGQPAAQRYLGDQTHILEHYAMSIHGKGLMESGLTVTAVCSDCHSSHGVLPAADPASMVHKNNIASTCGTCHDGIAEQYKTSVHSPEGNPDYEQLRGMPELPACNDCHSSHETARTDVTDFQLGIMNQCGRCHEDVSRLYFESYHGKASALGDTTRAKCNDCHGAHDVFPESDERSMLHETRVVATCGQCHEGSHESFTQYLSHADHHDRESYPLLFWAFWGMTGLLVGVFSFFGLHTLAWLPRSFEMRRKLKANPPAKAAKKYMRFKPLTRGLHITMVFSFFGLAITGMMLKFSGAGWARFLARVVGGIDAAGWIHRFCAIVTFGYMAVHLANVWGRYRRSDQKILPFLFGPRTILPTFQDVRDFFATVRWFFGKGPMPRYGRWTYWEKFDYFAVFWGVVIIGVSGLVLWFPVAFTHVLPGWAINIATIIHSDEALLATGFIFTVHFFNTQLRPDKFPMDTVMFTGECEVDELKHERPRFYEEIAASGELEERLVDPAPKAFVRLTRIFAGVMIVLGLSLAFAILYSIVTSILAR